jgi:PhnB protein
MATTKTPDMPTLTAHLVCERAAEAIAFYEKALGAEVLVRMDGPDGSLVHAGLRVGDSMLMLAGENPQWGSLGPKALKGSPVTIHMSVTNADAALEKAAAAGATVTMPATDMFWGDRYGQFTDPFGHKWAVAHRIKDLSPAEMQAEMTKMFSQPQGEGK